MRKTYVVTDKNVHINTDSHFTKGFDLSIDDGDNTLENYVSITCYSYNISHFSKLVIFSDHYAVSTPEVCNLLAGLKELGETHTAEQVEELIISLGYVNETTEELKQKFDAVELH